jgi:hypothetical protein
LVNRARGAIMGAMALARAALFSVATALLAEASGCDPRASSVATVAAPSWSFLVDAPAAGSHVLRIEGTFRNVGTPRLMIDDDAARFVTGLEVNDGTGWVAPRRIGGAWQVAACVRGCAVRYAIDLDALAASCDDAVDCAARAGEVTISPALVWLLHPQPKGNAPVTLKVRGADPSRFATGLRRAPGPPGALTYAFRSPELDEGSFTAFGPLHRQRVDAAGARIDVARLGGAGARMSDAEVGAWIGDAARCVARLYGRFPVDDATVFVVPVAGGSEVVFGKVLALAGASVALLVGDAMTANAAREDWVLVHELFHLGFPSFRGEGRWLGEGLATYYEPILRARSGWIDDAKVWGDFARQMPRGLPRPGASAGLVKRDDIDAIYWGGALFALMSDVSIRERTGGQRSLDDVIRAALAHGGDATRVWTVADVVDVGAEATGTDVLRAMYASHAARGEPIDLDGLLAQLGVERQPGGDDAPVILRDDAPLSAVRRAITARE